MSEGTSVLSSEFCGAAEASAKLVDSRRVKTSKEMDLADDVNFIVAIQVKETVQTANDTKRTMDWTTDCPKRMTERRSTGLEGVIRESLGA